MRGRRVAIASIVPKYQFGRHAEKEGIVVVAGSTGREIPPGTYQQILKQAGLKK